MAHVIWFLSLCLAAVGGYYYGKDACALTIPKTTKVFYESLASKAAKTKERLDSAGALVVPIGDCNFDASDVNELQRVIDGYTTSKSSSPSNN